MTNQILKSAQIIPSLEKIKGCKFCSFTYKAKGTGEISKVTVSLNISYANAKLADLDNLNNFEINPRIYTADELWDSIGKCYKCRQEPCPCCLCSQCY